MSSKLLSGRYILTILAGLAFVYAVGARVLSPEAIASIITMVFVSYFNKEKHGEEK